MQGEIRLGKWRPFHARQVISRRGFIWAAEAGQGLMAVRGFDLYAEEVGEMDWRLLRVIPVMRQRDENTARSAAGRFVGELLVLTPFNARSEMVTWFGASANTAVATVETPEITHRITMRFDDDHRLAELSFPRWGNPDGEGFREETFGVVFEGESRFGDVVLPASFQAGWWPGTERWDCFFRATIDDVCVF